MLRPAQESGMKSLGWIIAGVSAGLLYYLYTNPQATSYASGPREVDDAANTVGNWGTKQRVKGTGGNLVGKVKQGFGEATGDNQTATEGAVDQAVGSVKDAAGQAAHAVEDTLHDLNK